MSVSSSSFPESYCALGLMKNIDNHLSPRKHDNDSKDQTSSSYKTIKELKLSLNTIYSFTSTKTIFSPSIQNNKQNDTLSNLSINFILSAFNNEKSTIILLKNIMEKPKENLNNIINMISGYYSLIIKNNNGNIFCSDLFKVCDKNQRIKILKEICNTISEDCIHKYASHPIQTLIELASCEEEYKLIVMSFNDSMKILKAALNKNGAPIMIQCQSNDKMEEAIDKCFSKSGIFNKDRYCFIYNAKRVVLNSTIEENGIINNSNIFVLEKSQDEIAKEKEINSNQNINNNSSDLEDEWLLIFHNQSRIGSDIRIKIGKTKLVKEAINKFCQSLDISNSTQKNFKFIFNNKELIKDLEICRSGLSHMSIILVIEIHNVIGA